MRKFALSVLVLALSVMVVGCGEEKKTPPPAGTAAVTAPATTK